MRKTPPSTTAFATILLTSLLILSGCHHTPPARPERQTDPAISATLRMMQGSWISQGYVQSLAVTRSPFHSSALVDGVFSFIIDSSRVGHDTLYFTGLVRGQEGSMWIMLGQRGPTGCYTAGQYHGKDNETAPGDYITRARIDSGLITLYTAASDSMRYTYYDGVYRGRGADYMLAHYTTSALFSGAYTCLDSALIFRSRHITFDPDHIGRVSGSPAYDSFDINMDILVQKDSLNYIEFFDTRHVSESHSYTYRIDGDKINISPLGDAPACRLVRADQ